MNRSFSLKQLFLRILKKSDKHEGLLILLCLHILLRIPNLFEPYWYGDEAIYLTIGQALRNGLTLYQDTIDHKTPLIYFFAMLAPTQIWFRIILMVWMTGAIWCFFTALKNFSFSILQRNLSTLIFILFTTLPWLEGHIPNGELFVMGFICIALWLFSRIPEMQETFSFNYLKKETPSTETSITNVKLLFLTGVFCSLAILTKVPALFDVAGILVTGCILLWSQKRFTKKQILIFFQRYFILISGVMLPIILSFVYFFLKGAGQDYIDFALLYNFKYAGSWNLPFSQPQLVWLLSLQGKIFTLFLTFIVMFFLRRRIKPLYQWLAIWCMASLVGANLSLRPYPHYFLQVIPPLAILFGSYAYKKILRPSFENGIGILFVVLSLSVWTLIGFSPYSTKKYYQDFFQLITQKISREEYNQRFNAFMADNELATAILHQTEEKEIFIWGTNPMLYAQSRKVPIGRFTVAFHIQDFPGAFEETEKALYEKTPEFIVVMKNEQIKFPEFDAFLLLNYIPYKDLEHMKIYRRSRLSLL